MAPDIGTQFVSAGVPVEGDGIVSILLDNPMESCVMAGEIDPTISKQMDQNFSTFNSQLNSGAIRANNTADFLSEQAKSGFLLERQLVGAKAAGQLDRDSLAKSRLDVASVAGPSGVN